MKYWHYSNEKNHEEAAKWRDMGPLHCYFRTFKKDSSILTWSRSGFMIKLWDCTTCLTRWTLMAQYDRCFDTGSIKWKKKSKFYDNYRSADPKANWILLCTQINPYFFSQVHKKFQFTRLTSLCADQRVLSEITVFRSLSKCISR